MSHSLEKERVMVFDTTLRDGEQSPGASMTLDEKLRIAGALAALGVDVIEAGFPVASEGDFKAVQEIARTIDGPVIAGLARAREQDITSAARAIENSKRQGRIHTFIASSSIHRDFKLKMSKQEVIDSAAARIKQAKRYTPDVEFSAEDAGRTEFDFLAELTKAAIEAGATTINLPDTVGYCTPEQYMAMMEYIKAHVPNISNAVLSTHCHNDLGLAVANTLAGVQAGARQVEVTMNGIGERAGNADLSAVAMALHIHAEQYGVRHGIRTALLVPTSRIVGAVTWQPQRNSPIVGGNAFAHASGIHQDGELKSDNQPVYEIVRPQEVGWSGEQIILSRSSGRAALRHVIKLHNLPFEDAWLDPIAARFKELSEGMVENADRHVSQDAFLDRVYYPFIMEESKLNPVVISSSPTKIDSRYTVDVRYNNETFSGVASSEGEGVIDALKDACAKILPGVDVAADGFSVTNQAEGSRGVAIATIKLQSGDKTVTRTSENADTQVAICNAFLAAVNGLVAVAYFSTNQSASQSGNR